MESNVVQGSPPTGWLMRRWRRQGLARPLAVPDSAGRATGRGIWLSVLAGFAFALIWAARLPSVPETISWMLTSFGCGLSLFALSLVPELIFRRKHGLALLSDRGITLCDSRVTVPFGAIRDVVVLRLEAIDLDLLSITFDGARHYRGLLSPFGRVALMSDWMAEQFLTRFHLPLQKKLLSWAGASEDPNSDEGRETTALVSALTALEDLLADEARQRQLLPDRLTLTLDLHASPAISAEGLAQILRHHAALPGQHLDMRA